MLQLGSSGATKKTQRYIYNLLRYSSYSPITSPISAGTLGPRHNRVIT